jgi:hypothetical protein
MSVTHAVDRRGIRDGIVVRSRDIHHAIAGFKADSKVCDWSILAATTQVPDHNTTIATGGGDNAVVARLKTNLLDGRRVAAHNVTCLLSVHINDSGRLITGTGSKQVIVGGESHVHDSITVRFEANVVLRERVVRISRVDQPHTTLLIANSNKGVGVATSYAER